MILRYAILFLILLQYCESLLCYNGTFNYKTHGEDPITYVGPIVPSEQTLTKTRCWHTIACPENAMCFVRAWRARAKHSWIVQRGCYTSTVSHIDPIPRFMNKPTRAMSCSHRRLSEAEYKVCLCRANWCNSTPRIQANILSYAVSLLYLLKFV